MSFTTAQLYELLPVAVRIRDAERGEPLRALLDVVGEQVAILEESLEQLHDDQFIETCAPWVVPYLGDLLGVEGLPGGTLNSRAEVANTLAYRRRKGTASVLELLARDVFGLPARAVEYFQILATTQHLNHRRPENRSLLSIRDALRLESLHGPFEHLAGEADLTHTAEVRRIPPGRGRYNIPNVGVFVWRLRPFALTESPAVPDAGAPLRRFRFSPLGADAPLFRLPVTEDEPTQLAEPLNVPLPIGRRALHAALEDDYGAGRSFLVEESSAAAGDAPVAVDPARIDVCDLSAWSTPAAGRVAVDPVLGRLVFGDDQQVPPLVTFHYGFAGGLGGGEYDRKLVAEEGAAVVTVSARRAADFSTVQAAIDSLGPSGGVVEIVDSARYPETVSIAAGSRHVTLRASDGARPTLALTGDLVVSGDGDASVRLDGLLLEGGAVKVDPTAGGAALGTLSVRHCTLVPGISLLSDRVPEFPALPSLVVGTAGTSVELDACITGGVRAVMDASVRVLGSIVDGLGERGVAFAALDGQGAGAPLTIERSTVIGKLHTDFLPLVSNSLLIAARAAGDDPAVWAAAVQARQRQTGCIRFSYLPPDSRVPRRYRCQPRDELDAARVRPILGSARFGHPAYCQLAPTTPAEIQSGADDASEMGAFHDLYLPNRAAHLRARLDEYLRFGQEIALFYAT